jgi:hypothetical protein
MFDWLNAPPKPTIIGACYAGPYLAAENVRCWEWESYPRREPCRARERLPGLGPRLLKLIGTKPSNNF